MSEVHYFSKRESRVGYLVSSQLFVVQVADAVVIISIDESSRAGGGDCHVIVRKAQVDALIERPHGVHLQRAVIHVCTENLRGGLHSELLLLLYKHLGLVFHGFGGCIDDAGALGLVLCGLDALVHSDEADLALAQHLCHGLVADGVALAVDLVAKRLQLVLQVTDSRLHGDDDLTQALVLQAGPLCSSSWLFYRQCNIE